MYKKILIVIVVVIATGFVWWLASPLFLNKNVEESFPEAQEREERSLVFSDVVADELGKNGYKIFSNEQPIFSFEYPNNWYRSGGMRGDDQYLICLNSNKVAGDCAGLVTINRNTNLDTLYEDIKESFENSVAVTESEIPVAGTTGRLLTISGYEEGREGFTKHLFFEQDGYVYNIATLFGSEQIFNHIVQTFQLSTEIVITEDEDTKNQPTLLSSGTFVGADNFHQGSGSAGIYMLADGLNTVRLENFSVTNGPDLYVVLTEDAHPTDSDSLGEHVLLEHLKGNSGNQNYEIPENIDPTEYKSVVIYCKAFSVIFATASLN